MVIRLVKIVQEQGTFWVTSSFIWGWLLIPMDDVAEYYRHAGLRDARWSVLKGDAPVQEQLAAIASEEPLPDVAALVSELVYYTLSLGPLAERGDSYKYSFHLFIVRHDIVRLKAIEAGRTASM
jgi:hypothetical protein